VNDADDGGGVATLAETISEHLKESGIDSQIYASQYDHPKAPRIELYVRNWHGTAKISHQAAAVAEAIPVAGAVALATASNHIIVDCQVFLPDQSQPAFVQRFEHSGMGLGFTETDDNAAAASAGSAIVTAILTR
jgi:hypothetical protein